MLLYHRNLYAMKKRLLIVFLLILINITGFPQDVQMFATNSVSPGKGTNPDEFKKFSFKSYKTTDDMDKVPLNLIGTHPFGEIIARKSYLLDKKYVKEEELTPGNPATKVVIRKPVLYESVKSIERELKRAVRKDEISLSVAADTYGQVLDIALNIVTADTEDLELLLDKTRSPKSKLDILKNRVEIYF